MRTGDPVEAMKKKDEPKKSETGSSGEIILRVSLFLGDYLLFNLCHFYRKKTTIAAHGMGILAIGLFSLFGGFSFAKTTALIILSGLCPALITFRTWHFWRKNPSLGMITQYRISGEGIEETGRGRREFLEGDRIHRTVHFGKMLVIYADRESAFLIPGRFLGKNAGRVMSLLRVKTPGPDGQS